MLIARVLNWRCNEYKFIYSDEPFVSCCSIILTKEENMIVELNGNKLSYSEIKEVISDLRNMGYDSSYLKNEYLYSYDQAHELAIQRYEELYDEIKEDITNKYYINPLMEKDEYLNTLDIYLMDEGFECVGDYYILY